MFIATYLSASSNPGLIAALGIDWRSLVLNAIAFLVTVWVLAKFVYPTLVRTLDAKRDELVAASRLEDEAKTTLHKAEAQSAELVSQARKRASDVLETARTEAAQAIAAAEEQARNRAEQIARDAAVELEQRVRTARLELAKETARLVARATENVLDEKLNDSTDGTLIERSLERAKAAS